MDALTMLIADHNRVRGLFSRFKQARESDNTAEMAELAPKIFTELEVHTTIEEEIFYPTVHDLSGEVGEVVDEGIEEHHVAKMLMGEVQGLDPGADEWVAKMSVLMENVEHHAEEEEKEMFPKVRSNTGAEDRKALGERLDRRKGELGAPTLADSIDLTDEELRRLASEQAIPGRSSMSHEELAATVDPRG
jgi:hemerythrin superfamily protein